ncbi:Bor family protein [Methylolobus aquaticus]
MKVMSFVITSALLATGCATQTFYINPSASASSVPTKQQEQSFIFRGVGQTESIDAAKICGDSSKVVKVEATYTATDGLFEFLTLGIYAPRAARVYCAS